LDDDRAAAGDDRCLRGGTRLLELAIMGRMSGRQRPATIDVRGSGDGRRMDDDGQAGAARRRLARGTAPKAVAGVRGIGKLAGAGGTTVGPSEGPARSIVEAVERLMSEREAEEAIAEWAGEG
jgi:hypothetical protein